MSAHISETTATKHPYWLSWYHQAELQGFELHFPYWISGYSSLGDTVCAGVLAESEQAAMDLIFAAYDITPKVLNFRFVEELTAGKSVYSERFRQDSWMGEWPLDPAGYAIDHVCACSLHQEEA